MAYSQKDRICRFSSVLGPDELLLRTLSGEEALSRPFEFHLELFSENRKIQAKQILGTNAAVAVDMPDGTERFFNGVVVRFESGPGNNNFATYSATLRPWFWVLRHRTNCRIFQFLTVPEIIKKVFQEAGYSDFEDRLKGSYKQRIYCVQYRESDFDFVSRLLEDEGIFYFFEFDSAKHKLILADSPSAITTCKGHETVHYRSTEGGVVPKDEITSWSHREEMFSGLHSTKDFNFEDPPNQLLVQNHTTRAIGGNERLEVYDYHPQDYGVEGDGTASSKLRMQLFEIEAVRIFGQSLCRGFTAGKRFTVTDHPLPEETDKPFALVALKHTLSQASPFETEAERGSFYRNWFTCIPANLQYRPPFTTPKPRIRGPQTAIVVGPAGEEIYVDEYGRVKVQFHWDRLGKKNENSSCWVRVSQTWAGKKWGMQANPRIDDEVIVDFLEGDPDNPIITGCVYNRQTMPPYDLPANKTQTGIKTRSSKEGSPSNFNELRFEDKKGDEEVYIQAEKNKNVLVKNDRTEDVGHDETITIGNDRTEHVKHDETITIDNDRTEVVGKNETISIGVDRTETVGKNETITIGSSRTESVGQNEMVTIALLRTHSIGANDMLNVGAAQEVSIGGAQSLAVGLSRATNVGKDDSLTVAKKLTIDAGDQITIKTGDASITMKKDGTIVIKGKDISIKGSGKISVKADSDVTIKGSKIAEN